MPLFTKTYVKVIGASAGVLLCSSALAHCKLGDYHATYSLVYHGSNIGNIKQHLLLQGDHYHFSSVSKTSVLFFHDMIIESSDGSWGANGLRSMKHSVHSVRHDNWAHMVTDWKAHRIHYASSKMKAVSVPFKGQVYDPINYQIAMRCMLMKHPKVIHLTVLQKGKLHHWVFHVSKAMLKLPIGTMTTWKTVSEPLGDGSVETFWFAPKYHNLILKSTNVKNGDLVLGTTIQAYKPG